jgi:hypothetical protein
MFAVPANGVISSLAGYPRVRSEQQSSKTIA